MFLYILDLENIYSILRIVYDSWQYNRTNLEFRFESEFGILFGLINLCIFWVEIKSGEYINYCEEK